MSIRNLVVVMALGLIAAKATASPVVIPAKTPDGITETRANIALNAGTRITCDETTTDENTGNDVRLAHIVINFGADGKATAIQITRPKTAQVRALNTTFTKANSREFTHDYSEGNIESDEGQPKQYAYNISQVEVVHAKAAGISMTLALFDHLYAGIPGSTLAISQGENIDIGGNSGEAMVICKQTKLPKTSK